MSDLVTIDRATGEVVEAPQTDGCQRCKAEASRAATLEGDLRGAEAELRRQRRTIEALKAELRQQREEDPQAKEIREVMAYWQERLEHPTAKVPMDGERAKRVRVALRQKHTVAELKEAIDGCAALPYANENGRQPTGKKEDRHDDLTLICRDEATIKRFRGYAQRQQERVEEHRRRALDVPAVLSKLEGVRREKPDQWMARCPAHDDRHASLAVAQGEKGVVIHCNAGCQYGDITAALGVPPDALFAPDEPTLTRPRPKVAAPSPEPSTPLPSTADLKAFIERLAGHEGLLRRLKELRGWSPVTLVARGVGFDGERLTLPVRDAEGRLVNVMRYRPGGAKPKMLPWGPGLPRDLFPSPESFGDVDEFWICEGEADAVSGRELGLPVVSVPGANGWKPEWAPRFAGRKVVVCPDCDEPGRKLGERVAQEVASHAAEVRVVELATSVIDSGYDLTDALLEHASGEFLRSLVAEAPVVRRLRAA